MAIDAPRGTGRPSTLVEAPTVSLPKGGGAVRGIGDTFRANAANGTAAFSVPIPLSQGRSGSLLQLSLSYDSAGGNGPFGFGWTLGLPGISRKTEKGLPRYDDRAESDVFMLSNSDDLVPALDEDGGRFEDRSSAPGYVIHRYRPRIEVAFMRIERWTRSADGDVHWRSLSKDNVRSVYGNDRGSRIADPDDPARVFSWLICETRDDKGNVVVYDYKPEDGVGVDLALAQERHRGTREDARRTANRYLKRIRYGNRLPLLDAGGLRVRDVSEPLIQNAGWMFEVVFDYGEHDTVVPRATEDAPWAVRADAFSTYRPGFEVRTARRCRRVLMFHHFDDEICVGRDCLVRSLDFTYADSAHSLVRGVTQCGYRRVGMGYLRRALPSLELEYSQVVVKDEVRDVDAASLQHLPAGLESAYLWTDLHGEGIPGVLSEQAGAWYYSRNLSPTTDGAVALAPLALVAATPNATIAGHAQLLDLAADGQNDLVVFDGPTPGVHRHDAAEGWSTFRPFTAHINRNTRDLNFRFIDLDGDGRADVLVTGDDAIVWHPSLGESGFGPAQRVPWAVDEDKGPRLVLADAAQSIYTADMNGDGLSDLVRVRNGEVCYWPNLGYGRFGARVSMDGAPHLDRPDGFDQRRLRLADIDGSGTADLIYVSDEGATLYFNESGNQWSIGQRVAFPRVDNVAAVQVADLKGNGTACLVWSSALPGAAGRQMRYVDLMGGQKPHLLTRAINNLGAETVIQYASSTRFYLADKLAGQPWIAKLPFPVHVIERVETVDRVSGNRFVTRYAYHHGHFDGIEREFRGFGMVEQWDTEQIGMLRPPDVQDVDTNIDASSHVPPVLTKTWFHTGTHVDGDVVSGQFAEQYYREPALSDDEAHALLLADTVLPAGLTLEEQRQACRALKGVMLRQEVYALDGTDRAKHPYTVVEQNFTIAVLQRKAGNHPAVFHTHAREALTFNYERDPADPRTTHALTLEVDDYGNVRRSAAIAYGRRQPDVARSQPDRERQALSHITCEEHEFTNAIDLPDGYRAPLACESRTYELGCPDVTPVSPGVTFDLVLDAGEAAAVIPYEQTLDPNQWQKRLIAHARTQYRPDDLGEARGDALALLPLGQLESRALPGERYQLALTSGLVATVLGDRVSDAMLGSESGYVHTAGDGDWWAPSGRVFFSPRADDTPAGELAEAARHFFLTRRVRGPFHRAGFETEHVVSYDAHDFLPCETKDPLANIVTVSNDYRVLQPRLMTDANGNRSEVAYDALGLVVGTAVMGKVGEPVGDSLEGFEPDLDEAIVVAHFDDPLRRPHELLRRATTRLVYDLSAYARTAHDGQPQPVAVYTLSRETHDSDLEGNEQTRLQHLCTFSDGFGREIQKKGLVESGPLAVGGVDHAPRWVGSGWTIFNNKGNPVRQYEPFFAATHRFELARVEGVSSVLFYDPVGRVVATLNPDHTWQKEIFGAWREETWDANDAVLVPNPADDQDVGDHLRRLPDSEYLPTWYAARADGSRGVLDRAAALATGVHAATPSVAHVDALGRRFLTVAHNRTKRGNTPASAPPDEAFHQTRVVFDIQGRRTEVVDAMQRTLMRYDYDLLGREIGSHSMEAGERWTLIDIAGKVRYGWDSREHRRRTTYDALGRPADVHLKTGGESERLVGRTEYGEIHPDSAAHNLRGQPYRTSDGAGIVTIPEYDFKANALTSIRHLAAAYTSLPDWSTGVALEPEVFTTSTTFDALNRPVTTTTPDMSVIRRTYNEAGLVEAIDANVREAAMEGEPVWTSVVRDIDYDAKGKRQRIEYGNGVATTCDYDARTFRLMRLHTVRDGASLQDLSYTYDPVGNIAHIEDAAQQDVFFRNQRVTASQDFRYDAIYQLVEATGREHLGQLNSQAAPPTAPDAGHEFHVGLEHPGDGLAMGRYVERYVYDAVGNFIEMQHVGSDPSHPGWTRAYAYEEPSQLDPSVVSNRLSWTRLGGGPVERYTHDAHGSMTTMPHLPTMRWNDRDQLEASARQVLDEGTTETTWYVYDGSGQRLRKVSNRAAGADETPARLRERIYLGGFEVYREYAGDAVTIERETLHVMDGARRVALIETRTRGADGSAEQLTRYQMGNHLGSVSLELDDSGGVVSFEEHFPFGSASYQATDARVRAAGKRYRYTGMERDEESGLTYHTARHCADWLGRWIAADPLGLVDGPCVFRYARNNPLTYIDPNGGEAFNAGEQLSTFTDEFGNRLVEFRAKEGTWISASAKSLGLDQKFTKEQGYGAYVSGIVLNSKGQPISGPDTDTLEIGEVFYIRVDAGAAPEPQIDPEPHEGPPAVTPEGWDKYLLRNTIDFFVPDRFSVEGHGEVGVVAEGAYGGEFYPVGGGVAGTVITNPNSPDFLKVGVNPFMSVQGGILAGPNVEGGWKGSVGVTFAGAEHFGDARKAVLSSAPGPAIGGYLGGQAKAGVGASGAVVAAVEGQGLDDFWVETGVDVSGLAATGIGLTGEFGLQGKYTPEDPALVIDPVPAVLRRYHQSYLDWIHSGRQ